MNRHLLLAAALHLAPQLWAQAPDRGYRPIVIDPAFEHTRWGIGPEDKLYQFAAFTLSFDTDDDNDGDGNPDIWGVPEWVAFEIKAHDAGASGGRPTWMTDSALFRRGWAPSDATYHLPRSATDSLKEVSGDYRFVRGHMCPKDVADRISANAGYNTHTVLNAVPQLQWQNNGIWKTIEQLCTQWAERHGRVWVICGPVFFGRSPSMWLGQDGENRAAIPDALYKVVIRERPESPTGVESIAFIIPNIIPKERSLPESFITSIGRVERLTGLTFLTALPEAARAAEISATGDLSEW
jgi:endonuclease G, mitochondrial